MDRLEHIYRQFSRKTCFCNFTHFIVIYGLLQFFKFSDEEKMHAISTPSGIRNFHRDAWSFRFFGEINLPSSGFTLVEVAVRNKMKQSKWRGNVLPS